MKRGAYWGCVCEVSIDRSTGRVSVDKCFVAVDPGVVINPLQLRLQVQGGALMGLSHALHEEVAFDLGAVTTRDWRTYPILTMGEVPEMTVVILSNPETGVYEGASEAGNSISPAAVAGAVFDAIGQPPRRLPLKPAYVLELLKGQSNAVEGTTR